MYQDGYCMFIYDLVFVVEQILFSMQCKTPTDMKPLFDVSKIELVVSWGGKRAQTGDEKNIHRERETALEKGDVLVRLGY